MDFLLPQLSTTFVFFHNSPQLLISSTTLHNFLKSILVNHQGERMIICELPRKLSLDKNSKLEFIFLPIPSIP